MRSLATGFVSGESTLNLLVKRSERGRVIRTADRLTGYDTEVWYDVQNNRREKRQGTVLNGKFKKTLKKTQGERFGAIWRRRNQISGSVFAKNCFFSDVHARLNSDTID
jgi:hypothetical protein